MARKDKKPDMAQRCDQWLDAHPRLACVLVATGTFVALVGLISFITLSGFGASADFIYNQF